MKKFSVLALLGAVALSVLPITTASAIGLGGLSKEAGSTFEQMATPARAPSAYMIFCIRTPDQCRSDATETVEHSFAFAKKIREINNRVNAAITPKLDGKKDVWTIGAEYGDCEDFALTKRRDLIRAGVPAGALRMAVVLTEKQTAHAVLIVRTNVGDLVLDNRRSSVVASQLTGYTFLKIASPNPSSWLALNHELYLDYTSSKVRDV